MQSIRDIPNYTLAEAAHYVAVPVATVRSWVGLRDAADVALIRVETRQRGQLLLSFTNLVELHVLKAIRRTHGLPLPVVRRSVAVLADKYHSDHPLAGHDFFTDGKTLFIEDVHHYVDLGRAGQLALRNIIELYLTRIERDEAGLPVRLFPFVRSDEKPTDPRIIAIDPRMAFGRPFLVARGIPTAAIVGRFKAGETIESLAEDLACNSQEIQEALRYEHAA